MPSKPKHSILTTVEQSEQSLVYPFTEEEYRKGIATLKNNKAAGIDDVLVEQLKHLGRRAHRWLHLMLNTCFTENKILKVRRQSRIIATLKPGKDTSIPKSYRPISLLCHIYKLYKRLILNRITPTVESHLIKEKASFRPGKSCTSQLLNLTQDGYQNCMITRTAFVDLSAAYHTDNHRILIQKIFNTSPDSPLCRVIQNMLSSRRFYVELNNDVADGGNRKTACPREVFYHQYCLTYIQTKYIYIYPEMRSFIYADDLCVTAQYPSFTEVEETIEDALEEITQYYRSNSLRANPDKTQVNAFHLRNKEEKYS